MDKRHILAAIERTARANGGEPLGIGRFLREAGIKEIQLKRQILGAVARLSQQELADAVGSVREVVARALGKLRDEGLLRTHDGELELVEPSRLAEEAPAL